MAILGKRQAFFLNILAQDAVKTRSRDSWQRNTKSTKSLVSPSLSIGTKFSGKTFQENPGIQRALEAPLHLHISPYMGGREACRQRRPQKKGAVTTGLPGSACSSWSPRSRPAPGLECLISHESFDGVNSGSFHFVLCQSDALSEIHLENCQGPLLWSLGMAFLSDTRHDQRFNGEDNGHCSEVYASKAAASDQAGYHASCQIASDAHVIRQVNEGLVDWPALEATLKRCPLTSNSSFNNELPCSRTTINLCFLISNWMSLI